MFKKQQSENYSSILIQNICTEWAKNHFNTITFVKSWSYEQFFCLKPKSLLMSQFSNPKFFLVQFKCADVSKEEVWWEYKTNGALFLQSKTNVNARILEPKPLNKVFFESFFFHMKSVFQTSNLFKFTGPFFFLPFHC